MSKSKSDSDTTGTRAAAAAAAIEAIDNPSLSEVLASRNPGPSRLGKSSTPEYQFSLKRDASSSSSYFLKQSQSLGRTDHDANASRRLGRIFEDPSDSHEGQEVQPPTSPGDVSIAREGVKGMTERPSPSTSDHGSLVPSVTNDPDPRLSPFAMAQIHSAGSENDSVVKKSPPLDAFDWRGPGGDLSPPHPDPGLTWADMTDEAARPKLDPDRIPLTGRSLFLPEDSRFRRMCYKLVTNEMFENLILLIIVLDCIALAFDDPRDDPWCRKQRILFYW